jgi:hypothetical protein
MKRLIIFIVSVLLVALEMGYTANTAMAEEEGTFIANVLLDNEKVTVTENIRHPGTLTPMHTHEKPYVAYFFSPCKLQITTPKGGTKVKDIPAGKVVWSKGVTHEVKVLGNRDLHTLHIQFK